MPWLWLILILAFSSAASAQNKWTLTTADFHARQIDLAAIDDGGIHVAAAAGHPEEIVKWDQVLSVDRAIDAAASSDARFVLDLSSGDQLHGAPISLQGETLQWKSAILGPIDVSLRQVLGIRRADQAPIAADNSRKDDAAILANGDTVHGILTAISDGKFTMQVNNAAASLPVDSVRELLLASTALNEHSAAKRAMRIHLTDGSSTSATSIHTEGDRLILVLAGGKATRSALMSAVAAIEQLNGPVSWLSSRTTSENIQTPYFDIARPARMDRSVNGDPIRFGDRSFAHGIGVAPHSRITWPIDPAAGYVALRTQYAIDGNGPYADVNVSILLDGKTVYQKKSVTAGELSPVVVLPLGSARSLTFDVDFGGNYDVQNRFNWIEPALLRAVPTSSATRPATSP